MLIAGNVLKQFQSLVDFVHFRNHGDENPNAVYGRYILRQLDQGAGLVDEHLRVAKQEADAAHAEEGIGFGGRLQIGDRLVAADVEQAHGQRVGVGVGMHILIGGQLLGNGWRAGPVLEEVFGAEETDALGAVGVDVQEIFTAVDVNADRDAFAIGSQGRFMGVRERFGLEALQPGTGQLVLFERLFFGVDEEAAADSVDHGEHAGAQLQDFGAGAADEWDAETAGQYGCVGGGRAGCESDAYDVGLVEVGGIERGQVFCEQDCIVGQRVQLAGGGDSAQAEDEALAYIADVGGAAGEVLVAEILEESDEIAGCLTGGAGCVYAGVDGGADGVGECAVVEDFAVNEKYLCGCGLSDLRQSGQFLIDEETGCQKALPLFLGVVGSVRGSPAGIVGGDRGVFVNVADTDPWCC